MFILKPNEILLAPPRKAVALYDVPHGRIEMRNQRVAPAMIGEDPPSRR